MIEKEKNLPRNTLNNVTEKQQINNNLTPLVAVPDDRRLTRADPFETMRGWNYGIPGWYVERY
ncbi:MULTISPECIES: hypothetical protein [Okeania]|uniref:Uncharacterized protein n=1 Tax=Okeania hirsuta TaxID=1458930 RepID=A0A3N6P603_9CYAN|nr:MULTISPECIES: hypothetical protein [Okeania]NEP05393.1 hypothetical protein [Okeania sp. SIO4D6]NEP72290.1 hypothetical protein [Okeania sp. SIO2G5]NEP89895.1 hypothetical protein [Okeania sp. SIO2C2]NEP93191.1 hypothetical protein [Okeania sp. SIO2F5]NEQ90569.1 hypothetical protein [Okeania sp. SIO2G4]